MSGIDNKDKYLQFPLSLLRELFTNKNKTINEILYFGIYNYSINYTFQPDFRDIVRQTLYGIYRGGLSLDLQKKIDTKDWEFVGKDEDHNGFMTGTFNPIEEEFEELSTAFENDPELISNAIQYYDVHVAMNSLGFDTKTLNSALVRGKEIKAKINETEVYCMAKGKLLLEFRDSSPSEFEVAVFAAFLGIKSILGKKAHCRTNKEHIVSRMFGYSSKKNLPNKYLPGIESLFKKYSKRYHIDRILQELQLRWNIIIYSSSNMRGLYVGIKSKITLEELISKAETTKRKYKIQLLNQEKEQARIKVIQQLNKDNSLNKNFPF